MTDKPKVYLSLRIGPLGFEQNIGVFISNTKPDPLKYTRGEGQALIFELIDFDCSTEFAAALRDGRFINDFPSLRYRMTRDKRSVVD